MAQEIAPPLIDTRSYDDLVDQATELAVSLTSGLSDGGQPVPAWQPAADDPATALVQLFAAMMAQVVTRLNQVLENNQLAFLSLIGTEQQPPQAARVPLTFFLVSGSSVETNVPAGTPVAAGAAGAQPESVFTTERDLYLTRAQLVGAYVREPEYDQYGDFTAIATGQTAAGVPDPFAVFSGGLVQFTQVPHLLYLANDALFTQPNTNQWTLTFGFGSAGDSARFLTLLQTQIRWWYATPSGFALLWEPAAASSSSSSGGPWQVQFSAPSDRQCQLTVSGTLPVLTPLPVAGQTASWLYAELLTPLPNPPPAPLPPAIATLSATARIQQPLEIQPDAAYYNGTTIDLTRDFFPFGQRPALGDTFYVASAEVFAKPGSQVQVTVLVSDNIHATPTADLLLRWEVLTANGQWQAVDALPVGSSSSSSSSSSHAGGDPTFGLAVSCTIAFTLPMNAAPATQFGLGSAWLRVRIVSGSYGAEFVWSNDHNAWVPSNFQAPALQRFQLSYGVTLAGQFPADGLCLTANDQSFARWLPGQAAFTAVDDALPTLYLGFDRRYANQEVSIYVQVDAPQTGDVMFDSATPQPAQGAVQLEWQYRGLDDKGQPAWKELAVVDGTDAFSHSDVIVFVGPSDFQPALEFGRSLFWIRAQRAAHSAPYLVPRRLLRIVPNTVWAANLVSTSDEIIGSSDGSQSQRCTLSQTPVLAGEVIEVDEPTLTSDDVAALVHDRPGSVTELLNPDGSIAAIWVRWIHVPDFYASGPFDRHYMIDYMAGAVTFGDGSAGMIPNAGTRNLRASYASGGGAGGNQPALQITQLKTTVPYVSGTINYDAASGGSDQESLAAAKLRGAASLRNGNRAITQQDYIDLALAASPAVARATAIMPAFDATQEYQNGGQIDPDDISGEGQVVVIVVPASSERQPVPGFALLERVRATLAASCPPAVQPEVYGPMWVSIKVSATVVPQSPDLANQVVTTAVALIDAFLHPLTGNGGAGWDFGALPYESQLYALLANIPGVRYVVDDSVTLTPTPTPPGLSPWTEQRQRQSVLVCSALEHDIQIGAGT